MGPSLFLRMSSDSQAPSDAPAPLAATVASGSRVAKAPRPRWARWALVAATFSGVSLAIYAVVPLLVGGASAEERRLIEAAWDAEVAFVLEAAFGLEEVGGGGEPWEGSDLQAAAKAREPDDVDGLFRAIGSGESCPVPTGSTAAMEFWLSVGGNMISRSPEEVLGVLRLTRRMEQQAPDLITLMTAIVVGDEALSWARAARPAVSALASLSAPDPDEMYRAFCREQVALQAGFGALEAGGETLEMTALGLKVASLHEARRLRTALAGSASRGTLGAQAPVSAPGRLAVWRAMWLQRPAELSEVVFLPLITSNISGAMVAWKSHLAEWDVALSGR